MPSQLARFADALVGRVRVISSHDLEDSVVLGCEFWPKYGESSDWREMPAQRMPHAGAQWRRGLLQPMAAALVLSTC
jgi:hypothetical protein